MKKQMHSWSLGSGEMLIVAPPSFIRQGLIARVLPPGTTSQSHSEFPYSDLQGPPFLSPPCSGEQLPGLGRGSGGEGEPQEEENLAGTAHRLTLVSIQTMQIDLGQLHHFVKKQRLLFSPAVCSRAELCSEHQLLASTSSNFQGPETLLMLSSLERPMGHVRIG